MKSYELTYIISPEITSEEAISKAKEIESAIQAKEGTILKQISPVAKTLSYPIKKYASGFFGVLEFQLEPEKLLELKEMLSKDEKIVRHAIIIKEVDKVRKERRSKARSASALEEAKTDISTEENKPASSPKTHSEPKGKVELKDIEEKLEEILG